MLNTRTIDTTPAAKHIAAQHGLHFVWVRKERMWKLESNTDRTYDNGHRYSTAGIQDLAIDTFYEHCINFAYASLTPVQMDMLIACEKYAQASDDCMGMSSDAEEIEAFNAMYKATKYACNQVRAACHVVYNMRQDAEAVSGSYWEHKQQVREAQEAQAVAVADEWQPEAPEVTQARDNALLAQRRTVQPNTLEAATEQKCMQHIQSFLHMVGEGKSYPEAWAVIKSRSTFGPKLLDDLYSRCIKAARAVDDNMRAVGEARMKKLGKVLMDLTPEVIGKPSIHFQACTEDRIAFVVSNLRSDEAARLAEFIRNM